MFRLYFFLVLILLLGGCANNSDDGTAQINRFDYPAMFANYADNIISPGYRNFYRASQQLAGQTLADTDGVVTSYCNAIGTDDEAAARLSAQIEWQQLQGLWQQAEVFLLGPVSDNNLQLRNTIYLFSSREQPFQNLAFSECATDQSVVLAQGSSFDIATRSFSARGLEALEYLLFNDELDHQCPAQITVLADWNDLDDDVRKQQRCEYAKRIAIDINLAAEQLVNAWDREQGDYRTQFVNPNGVADNLQALSEALFYLEKEVKDTKLGIPTGLKTDQCDRDYCPETVESIYAEVGYDNILANLQSFRALFNGAGGLGFDDLINEVDASVTQSFNQLVDQAITLIENSPQTLNEELASLEAQGDKAVCVNSAANPSLDSPARVCALQGYLKQITDKLRIEFVAIVNTNLPERVSGDAD